jgi:hypothetical protein
MTTSTKIIHDAFLAEHEAKHAKHFNHTSKLKEVHNSLRDIYEDIIKNEFLFVKILL